MTSALLVIHGLAIILILYHHIVYPLLLNWLTRGKNIKIKALLLIFLRIIYLKSLFSFQRIMKLNGLQRRS